MQRPRRAAGLALLAVAGVFWLVGCGESEPSGPSTLVALGDSWPEGAHCGGCRTFAGRYADGLAALTGREIEFKDLTGEAEPFWETEGGGSAGLLKALREDTAFRNQVATGDVIMIAHGPNELDRAFMPYREGTCGGTDGRQCIRELGAFWDRNFDAILDEIEELRGGKATAVRLVNAANVFVSEPEIAEGLENDFATDAGAQMFSLLTDAICENAKKHKAACVDVRPILNGPSLDQRVDENSETSMKAVAEALLATGLPEFD